MMSSAIELCGGSIVKINSLISKLEAKCKKSELLGRLRIAINDREIRDMLQELGQVQMTLMLAMQMYSEAERRADHATLLNMMHGIASTTSTHGAGLLGIESLLSARLTPANSPDIEAHTYGQVQPNRAGCEVNGLAVYSTSPEYERRPPSERRVLCMHLRPWFMSTTYDMAISRSAHGWTARLVLYNCVPVDAPIFEYIKRSDLNAVRKLIAEGQASPLDRDPRGCTTLWYAACHGLTRPGDTAALLRDLIEPANFPDAQSVVNKASSIFYCGSFPDYRGRSQAHGALGVVEALLDSPGFDVEDGMDTFLLDCLFTLATSHIEQWDFYSRRLNFTEALTLSQRFDLVTQTRRALEPDMLLKACGVTTLSSQLVAMSNSTGATLLHNIASGKFHPNPDAGATLHWQVLLQQAIQLGADLTAVDTTHHATPLMMSLNDLTRDACMDTEYRGWDLAMSEAKDWLGVLAAAGVPLTEYGQAEAKSLPNDGLRSRKQWLSGPSGDYMVSAILYDPTASDWDFVVRIRRSVPIFRSAMSQTPGAWPHSRPSTIPQTVCWSLCYTEEDEGVWTRSGTVDIHSAPIHASTLAEQQVEERDTSERLYRLFSGAQDDHGLIPLLAQRGRRQFCTVRSASTPPLSRGRDKRVMYHGTQRYYSGWPAAYHLCPSDYRWNADCSSGYDFIPVRECLQPARIHRERSPQTTLPDWRTWGAFMSALDQREYDEPLKQHSWAMPEKLGPLKAVHGWLDELRWSGHHPELL